MKMKDQEYNRTLLREYYRGNEDLLYYILEYNLDLIIPIINKFKTEFNLSNEYVYINVLEQFINAINKYSLEKSSTFENYVNSYIEVKLEEKFRNTNYQYKIKK